MKGLRLKILFLLVIAIIANAGSTFAAEGISKNDKSTAQTDIKLSDTDEKQFFSKSSSIPMVDDAATLFSMGDIELTQGIVNRNETDVYLPGYGGLSLAINRYYRSSDYRSDADLTNIVSKNIGNGMGRGWGLSYMGRAYVIDAVGKSVKTQKEIFGIAEVCIDLNGYLERYEKKSDGLYRSANPENRHCVKVL